MGDWWISPAALRRLDAEPAAPVVTVVAPAGSGKSRLVTRWLETHPDRAHRWADAARDDRDGILRLAQEAADELRPGNDAGEPGPGNDAGEPGPGNDAGEPGPGNDAGEPGPGNAAGELGPGRGDHPVLVVSRAEFLDPAFVSELIDTVPAGVRLVLVAAGEVLPAGVEVDLHDRIERIGPADLWWPAEVVGDAELMRVTGGWPAGVLLGGDREAVLEFVTGATMAELPPSINEFVIGTAALEVLEPGACAALVPGVNPHTMLIDLRRFGLLDDAEPFAVHPRYRAPVREAALRQLRQGDPEAETRSLRRAAEDARGRGDPYAAFRWFARAGAWDEAFAVLADALPEGLKGWRWSELRDILRAVPASARTGDAERRLHLARALVLAGAVDPEVDLAPGNDSAAHLLAARAAQFSDPRAVRQHLAEAGQGHAPAYVVVGGLGADAYVAAREGELNHAQRSAARARTIAENAGLLDHPFLAGVVLARVELLRARGRVDEALHELHESWALLTEHEQVGGLAGRPVRSAAQLLRASLMGEDEETDDNLPSGLQADRAVVRARILLRRDEIASAEALVAGVRTPEAAALTVEAALRRQAPEVAQRALEAWPAGNTTINGLWRLLSRAALALALDRRAEAGECIQAAITAAEPDGHLQAFLEARPTVWSIAAAILKRPGSESPWRKELARRLDQARADAEPADAPVTRRERVVLEHLARPLTHAQIAQALFVSENTLKSHCRNLYRKLGVSARSDALLVARARGWLPPEPRGDVVLNLDAPTADVEL